MNKLIHGSFFTLALIILLPISIQAQIGEGGTPPSFKLGSSLKSTLKSEFVQPPDLQQLRQEDKVNDSLGNPYRMASMISVDLCMNYSGTWDTLTTGEVIWRLKVTAPGASGVQLIFDNFYLPSGGKLFVYNEDKSFVIGAFTEKNNHPSRVFATEIIPGESCILEYVSNPHNADKPAICISKVGYVYRGMGLILPGQNRLKSGSGSCEVSINCSPEGDNWKDVKRAVARIIMSGYYCSGTLLNNTAQDFKNLFSTAYHCVKGHESESLTWVFYFNYENSTCSNSSRILSGNTVTGAEIRAEIPMNGGSDAVLLELTGAIPVSYNVYWAGWDVRDTTMSGGVCIHHPAGDAKKISTIRSQWRTETWHGKDSTVGVKAGHWSITFTDTKNGFGTTEGGSSGSGLFGPDERFRGQLSGGSSSCSIPYGDNLFGKLSYSWDKYGTASNVQLKPWLDPLNIGAKMLNGTDHNTQKGVFWTSSPPVISADSVVRFHDESLFNPTSWNWTFDGGTPATSTEQNPVVSYSSPGLYNVSLTVTNDKGTNTKTRTDYVYVKPKPVWIVQNSQFPQDARGIQGFSMVDSAVVWAWAYDGTDPSSPLMEYTRTTDGGNNWKADSIVLPGLKGYAISNIYALNKDTAYAALFGPNGGGTIVRTTDAGRNWIAQSTAAFSAPNGFPNVVYFFDALHGVCMGDPNNGYFEIYTTSNSGTTWSRISSRNIPSIKPEETGTTNYYDAVGDTIWFGTSNGRVFRSVNRGQAWTVSNTGLGGRVDVKFRNSKVGMAVQLDDSLAYALSRTTDGGITWANVPVSSSLQRGYLTKVPKSNSSWINVTTNPGGSAFSADDGTTFNSLDYDNQYTSVAFYNEFIGWAGGFNQDSLNGGIYKWDKRNKLLTSTNDRVGAVANGSGNLFSIQPNPAKDYFVLASNSVVLKDIKVLIINSSGELLDHFTFINNQGEFRQTIGISNLTPGLYFVLIQMGSKTETLKVVVE
jgi:PKD repeat protein